MQRGSGSGTAPNFNCYAYANNNPYKYVNSDSEFGTLGDATRFTIEGAVPFCMNTIVNAFERLQKNRYLRV